MIRLQDILLESKASEEAKRQGLTHTSFGRYADSSGKVVAMSRSGKLVPIKGSSSKKSHHKKRNDHAAKSGIIQRYNDHLGKDRPRNDTRQISPHVFRDDIKDAEVQYHTGGYTSTEADESGQSKEQKESIKAYEKLSGARKPYSIEEITKMEVEGRRAAYQQHKNWKSKMPVKYAAGVGALLYTWQSIGARQLRKLYPTRSKQQNKTLNDVIAGKYTGGTPAKLVPPDGTLTRGLRIELDDVEEFLSSYQIGNTLTIPPMGWSTDARVGREFSGHITANSTVGVIMSLRGKGKSRAVTGLALSESGRWLRSQYTSENDFAKSIDEIDNPEEFGLAAGRKRANLRRAGNDMSVNQSNARQHYYGDKSNSLFNKENEVITPGWMNYKVMKATKHIFETTYGGRNPKVWYEIEMEEAGKASDDMVMEAQTKKMTNRVKKLLFKYMNSSLRDDDKRKGNGRKVKPSRR